MLSSLKQLRKFANNKDLVCIIIGNESCDLDSSVSAVTLAYLYQQLHNQGIKLQHTSNAKKFLPVLNIPREDYALKTEVNYVFEQHGILEKDLTFRNDLHDDFVRRSDFILVDHHVSPFSARCVQIFDHRPLDATQQFPENCPLTIERVDSCATIIAQQYFNYECTGNDYEAALSMLYKTIILDTINFDVAADRATPSDVAVCKQLEQILKGLETREQIFASLVHARGNVSSLTALQLLRKDMKVLTNQEGNIKIALSGFPLSVQDFICKNAAFEQIETFAQHNQFNIVLLMGLEISENGSNVKRDIGLIDINSGELWCAIRRELLENESLNLKLQPKLDCKSTPKACFYQQQNIKITRKQILPAIKNLIESWGK